jgi:hypothetical protein
VYLDTSRDTDDPDAAIELRRRHQRDALRAQGADAETVSALDAAMGADRDVPGRHGQALFAAHGRLALTEELPEPPTRDTARYGDLPDALPLAVQHAPDIPYLAVALARSGPPLADDEPLDDVRRDHVLPDHVLVTFQTGRWPAGRVLPGPRHTRLLPVGQWRQAATGLARELEDAAGPRGVETVVVGRGPGDAWLSGALVDRLPVRLRNRVALVECRSDPAAHDRALLEPELARVMDGRLTAADRRQWEAFLAQRARHPHHCEGIEATVRALRRGQARALLVTDPARLPETLQVGAEPSQIALSAEELGALGATLVHPEPAGAALLYAAARTGADLIVPPPDRPGLADGVGVLLRYRDPADTAPQ